MLSYYFWLNSTEIIIAKGEFCCLLLAFCFVLSAVLDLHFCLLLQFYLWTLFCVWPWNNNTCYFHIHSSFLKLTVTEDESYIKKKYTVQQQICVSSCWTFNVCSNLGAVSKIHILTEKLGNLKQAYCLFVQWQFINCFKLHSAKWEDDCEWRVWKHMEGSRHSLVNMQS
jgi:hypothetical protein